MIEEDLPQEKSRPHVPPLNHPRSTNSGPYDRPIGNAKQGSSCEVCQQTIGEWEHYPLDSIPMWKFLFQRDVSCKYANIYLISLVSRSAASSSSAMVLTSI